MSGNSGSTLRPSQVSVGLGVQPHSAGTEIKPSMMKEHFISF